MWSRSQVKSRTCVRGRCDDEVAVLGLASDGEVCLDGARLVQPLGVHHAAHGNRDVVGTDAVEDGLGVRAGDDELAERREVEHADTFANRSVLSAGVVEPVLLAIRVLVHRLNALRGEPVGPLPPGHLPEARTSRSQPVVQRRPADAARGGRLAKRPVHVIEQAEHLDRAVVQVGRVALKRHHAANVDIPEVHGGGRR